MNGVIGWGDHHPTAAKWVITVRRPDTPDKRIPLPALAGLPGADTTNELKCVEGWS